MYFEGGDVHELGGFDPKTTNNRMELQGAIAALDCLTQILPSLKQTTPIFLYTDSEYVKNGITKWLKGWKKKGWKTSAGKPVLNMDLWQELEQLNQTVQATLKLHWEYVKGHSGNMGNDRTDAIASGFAQGHPPTLHTVDLSNLFSQQTQAKKSTSSQRLARESASSYGQSSESQDSKTQNPATSSPSIETADTMSQTSSNETSSGVSNSGRSPIEQLRSLVETFRLADEIAAEGYVLTSAEVADLVGISSSTVSSRGESWIWRNWKIQRTSHEGQQIFWQLERIR